MYLMKTVESAGLREAAGGVYNTGDMYAMVECNKAHLTALEQITGTTRTGAVR